MPLKVKQYLENIESSFSIPLKENDLLKVDARLNHPVSPKTLFKEQLRVEFALRKLEAYQSIRGNRSSRQIKHVKPVKTLSTTTPEAFASLMEVRRIFKAIRNSGDTKSESDLSSSRNSSPEIASDSDSE
jgi:hypothetical protein